MYFPETAEHQSINNSFTYHDAKSQSKKLFNNQFGGANITSNNTKYYDRKSHHVLRNDAINKHSFRSLKGGYMPNGLSSEAQREIYKSMRDQYAGTYSDINLQGKYSQGNFFIPHSQSVAGPINTKNRFLSEISDANPKTEMYFKDAHNYKSNSAKKLLPINSKLDIKERKNRKLTQSLMFNQGLTFVLRKGKALPTEKYISNSMMPYTAMDYQSVQVKSNKNRQALTLSQIGPQP